MSTLRVRDIGDSLVTVTFETEGNAPFVIGEDAMAELCATIEELGKDTSLSGVLFRSARTDVFCAGADVDAMADGWTARQSEEAIQKGQQLFESIAQLPCPTVALIDGTCLGGGLELALACKARIATPDRHTRLGLPETKLGILPAWGGCTRLPRLIGLRAAIPLVTAGKTVDGKKAHRLGIVDDVVPREQMVSVARDLVRRLSAGQALRRPKRGVVATLLDGTRPGRALVYWLAKKAVVKQTKGRFPAPVAALDVMARTADLSIPESLDLEREHVGKLLKTAVHGNLLRLFRITRDGNRPEIYGAGRTAAPPSEIAVIGGGTMGAGIAALAIGKGLGVRLIDPSADALSRAMRAVEKELARRVRRRDLGKSEAHMQRTRFTVATEISGLRGVDCVIEAAPERLTLKREILGRVIEEASSDALIATNTSSLPLSDLEDATDGTDRFLGLHFFNPPGRMPLLELVRGASTSNDAIGRGLALAKKLGKTPIVVGDGPGFLVNRVLAPYFLEACRIADEGMRHADIDAAITAFGFPMGPFRLMDEVGLDVIADAGAHAATREGYDFELHPAIVDLVAKGHLGKKSGRGFYPYGARGRADSGDQGPPSAEIAERLVQRMVDEARRLVVEGIVLCPEDVDIGTVFGIGFPPDLGGLLHWAEDNA